MAHPVSGTVFVPQYLKTAQAVLVSIAMLRLLINNPLKALLKLNNITIIKGGTIQINSNDF
jgi:hypothetical protein